MKIILSEKNFSYLIGNLINEEYNNINPITNKVKQSMLSLNKLLERDGIIMINIENQKEYLVYEDITLENLIGKKYCHCRLLKDGKPFGPIYTKPMVLFKMKMY